MIRSLGRVQFLALVGIGIVFFASTRPWAYADLNATNAPALHLSFTGRQLDAVPVALAALSSIFVVLAGIVRSVIRRLFGIVIMIVAGSMMVASQSQLDPTALVDEAIADSIGTYQDNVAYVTTHWSWVSAFGAILVLLSGAILVLVAFPDRIKKAKYERVPDAESLTDWQALDQGIDPTHPNSTPLD